MSKHLEQKSRDLGHEIRDVNIKGIVTTAVVLVVVVVVVMVGMKALFVAMKAQQDAAAPPLPALYEADVTTPKPHIQAIPATSLEEHRAYEDDLLNGYGWVDEKANLARVPIGRAMELALEAGLPARAAPAAATPVAPAAAPPRHHRSPRPHGGAH